MNARDTAASVAADGTGAAASDDAPSRSTTPDEGDPRQDAARDDAAEPPPSERGLTVELQDATGAITTSDLERLDAQVSRAIAEASRRAGFEPRGEFLARVVDDTEMTRVHAEFLEDDTTTDVITFDLTNGASAEDGRLDVNAYLCLNEAERQSADRAHDTVDELTLYALHAALHCLGENDATDEAFERMHAREDEVLSAIGLGPVFGLGARDGGNS